MNKKKMMEFGGCILLSAVLFLVIYKFIPVVYSTNDDRMIAEIVSGQFTGKPESYGIQMTYGFTWFLCKLYEMSRTFNWYGIVLIASQIVALGTIFYRLQSFTEKWQKKVMFILGAIGAFSGVWLKVYVQLTYTTTAAFVGMAAIFWYATSETNWKSILMTGLLANLAFCIRPNIFYMLLPCTGLIYLWKLIGKKDFRKLTIGAPFIILSITLCLFLVNARAYSKDGWMEFRNFFDVRTNVYDYYDLLPYEEYPELYEPYGISQEEFNMMRVYNYTVLDEIPKEFFPEYLEAVKELEKQQGITFVTKSVNAVRVFLKDVFTGAYGAGNTLLFVGSAVLFLLLLWKRNFLLAIYFALQCGVINILWLYFTYWGRAIERIQVTMSLILLAVLLHTVYEMKDIEWFRESSKNAGRILSFLAVACLLMISVKNVRNYRYENIAKAHWYQDAETIKEYCAKDPERLYFMDIATMTELYGKCTLKNTEPEYINYISMGDWTAYSPHYEEKLKRHGVENVAESITDENAYVVMLHNYQLKCMKEYLHVEEEWVETIFGADDTMYAVYQFQIN